MAADQHDSMTFEHFLVPRFCHFDIFFENISVHDVINMYMMISLLIIVALIDIQITQTLYMQDN